MSERETKTLSWDEQAEQVIKALAALGINQGAIEHNTYIFRFRYRNYAVEMANHGSSLQGTVQRASGLLDERLGEALERGITDERTLSLVKQHEFKKFHYKGNPPQLVQAVIKLADTPIGRVAELQDYIPLGVVTKII